MIDATKTFILYGAGDPGTHEIRETFRRKGVPFEFRDIRYPDAEGNRSHLEFLRRSCLTTVPQVYYPDLTYLGQYEETLAFLEAKEDATRSDNIYA